MILQSHLAVSLRKLYPVEVLNRLGLRNLARRESKPSKGIEKDKDVLKV